MAPLSFALAALLTAGSTTAAQKWPFMFDVSLSRDPNGTSQLLAAGEMTLPDLPVSMMVTMQSEQATLYYVPESAALLRRIQTSGPGPAVWPETPMLCAHHATFVLPPLLGPGASAACKSATIAIEQQLADLGACRDVEEPERFVLGFPPAQASVTLANTGTITGLVGLAGEGLVIPTLIQGLLPDDFVPTMRIILDKIRYADLVAHLDRAQSAYAQAIAIASSNASCFDPTTLSTLLAGLDALTAELMAARAYLDRLRSEGEAEYAREDLRLGARSRARLPLPYPSLTIAERRFTAFWLGGIYWRMRGGGLIPTGMTQEARFMFFLRPFEQIGNLAGGSDGSGVVFPMYLDLIINGWSQWMDMGCCQTSAHDEYYDLVAMSQRGYHEVQASAQQLAQKGYDTGALITGGLQMGPCYFYGWYPLRMFTWADPMPPPFSAFMDGPTAIGEFCTGASIALGFADTLLNGYATHQPPTCTIQCSGKTCGDDGCGGMCGTCPSGQTCQSGQCECAGSTCAEDAGGPPETGGSIDAGGEDTAPPSEAPPDAANRDGAPPETADAMAIATADASRSTTLATQSCSCAAASPRSADGVWPLLLLALGLGASAARVSATRSRLGSRLRPRSVRARRSDAPRRLDARPMRRSGFARSYSDRGSRP